MYKSKLTSLQISSMSDQDREFLARVLKTYFPELGTDEELSGADCVEQLNHMWEYTAGFLGLSNFSK